MNNAREDAMKLSDEGTDAIKSFITGFANFCEKKDEEESEKIKGLYSEMNLVTLLYNAMIIKKELEKRYP